MIVKMKQGVFCQFTLIKTSTLHTLQLLLQLQIDSFTPEDARNTLDMKFLLIVTVTYPTIYFLFTIVIFHFRWGAILFALKHFLSLSPVTNETGDNAASLETANTATHCRADNPIPPFSPMWHIYSKRKYFIALVLIIVSLIADNLENLVLLTGIAIF